VATDRPGGTGGPGWQRAVQGGAPGWHHVATGGLGGTGSVGGDLWREWYPGCIRRAPRCTCCPRLAHRQPRVASGIRIGRPFVTGWLQQTGMYSNVRNACGRMSFGYFFYLRHMAYRSFLLAITCIALFSCSNEPTLKKLQKNIESKLAETQGDFAVAFKDLSTGEELLINDQSFFHAASTMKTPVMIEVYKQAAEGKFSLNDSFPVKNLFRSIVDSSLYALDSADDSEKELYRHLGEKRTLYQLVYDMIINSSNLATNMVIELVDARNVTQTMRQLGARHIQVLRGVEDSKAFRKGLNNVTNAYDLMVIYEKMAKGEIVDSASCQAMIDILLDQQFNEKIPALLPKNVKVAHKTGNIKGVEHDSGIVFLPNGKKYVLVLLSKNLVHEEKGVKAMAEISKMIYNYASRP
jgi:Beta-lactamase class A